MSPAWLRPKRVRRDYSRKSYSNPLFHSRSRGPSRWRGRLTALAILGALGGWIWFVGFSPTFRVDTIEIRGNESIPEWEIRDAVTDALKERRWLVMPQTSLLIASEDGIKAALEDRYVLESLTVTKRPPRTLVIELKERVSAVLLQMPDGRQGLVDLQGAVTRVYKAEEALEVSKKLGPSLGEKADAPKTRYPVLFDDRDEKLELREEALHPNVVQAAIELPGLFEERFGRAPYFEETRIDGKDAQTIRLRTSEGWSIYLDAAQDLRGQLLNAEVVLRTKVGAQRPQLDYIDVRFGEKVFFKLRS
ncbi:MAG TPA: FtsQ-type POTRA domain-containing protein [Candidatus Baltobacteraceae bacterium]|nr:FtsQ-type POTRA domain-containing protein [Candidatus Baltobacteraceae bacterium]